VLNLREYSRRRERLADHLPWAALVAEGVVLNKDGSFQRSFAYRGPDLESATEAELVAASARLNNALKRLGSGWALFVDAVRVPANAYPSGNFPDAVSALVDAERRAAFEAEDAHFESRFHLTLVWLPDPDRIDRAGRMLVTRTEGEGRDWRQALARFVDETDRVLDLLRATFPEAIALDSAATLAFLHGAISARPHPVAVPETPMYLDAVLAGTELTGGLEPMLGDLHLRTLTVLGFPGLTRPAMLDALNHLGFAYRWATRFIALDKTEATRALTRIRRQWFNKRKSVTALLREVMYNQPAQLLDSDADNKVLDAAATMSRSGI
jgi:type IV secretion system protein TrbE